MRSTDLDPDDGKHAMHMSHGMPSKTAAAHMGSDRHAGHSVAMFRDKFWLSFALTIPVVFLAGDVQHWLRYFHFQAVSHPVDALAVESILEQS